MLEILLFVGHDLIRTGLRTVLESQPDWNVVSVGGDTAREITELVRRISPDVVVSDLSLAVLSAVRTAGPPGPGQEVPVVMIGDDPPVEEIRRALRAGARGVVVNSGSSQHVIEAVRAVSDGYAYLAPSVTAALLAGLTALPPIVDRLTRERLESLTARERQVLRLIATGWSTAEVAERLHLSRATVKSHVSHALSKIGVQDRAQAVVFAHRTGLVRID